MKFGIKTFTSTVAILSGDPTGNTVGGGGGGGTAGDFPLAIISC